MVSVGLIYNPKSGENKKDIEKNGNSKILRKYQKILRHGESDGGWVYKTSMFNGDLNLESIAKNVYKHNPDVVAIASGDGLVGLMLTELSKQYNQNEKDLPPIAVLKSGTFNNLAKRMDIKKPFTYLQNIANTNEVNNLSVQGIKMMHVKDDQGYENLCFSTGVGFPVNLLEEVYKKKHMKYLRIGLMAMRAVGSAFLTKGEYYQKFNKKNRMLVTGEGHSGEIKIEDDLIALVAQSIDSLGIPKYLLQPKIFRNAEAEGRFHAVATALNFEEFLYHLPAVYMGRAGTDRDPVTREEKPVLSIDNQLKWMNIKAEEPFRYMFNGELSIGNKLCKTKKLSIKAGDSIHFVSNDFKVNGKKKLKK